MVTIKMGEGRITDGNFNLVHLINLTEYEDILARMLPTIHQITPEGILKAQLNHQVQQINNLIAELKQKPPRKRRSINWIGSAWKWVAGNPDAADWDSIVKSQNEIIENNNQQYKINRAMTNTVQQILQEYNKITKHLSGNSNEQLQQVMFNRLSIIKEEMKEMVRAAQLAKAGIINTNLLDREEIGHILAEVETLPYSNQIEAIEYAEPKMTTRGPIILYVISIPKTSSKNYNHVAVRSTIENGKQIYLEHKELLINQHETYGIIGNCHNFKEATICRNVQVQELLKDHCINQVLRGINAKCDYQSNEDEHIETLNENTIFLNNFNGTITQNNIKKHRTGNFLIQLFNETIQINNKSFTSKEVKMFEVLPSILQRNITEGSTKLDLKHLHSLHWSNVRKLEKLFAKDQVAALTDAGIIAVIAVIIIIITARKLCKERQKLVLLPKIEAPKEDTINNLGLQPISLNF